jgi:putative ABC transport system permease protein
MEKQLRMFTLLLGAIGSISLLVGGIGIMNVLLVSVSERRKEIGIRRAIGAKQIDIQLQFLIESFILTTVGGILGIVVGIATSFAISKFSDWEFIFSYISIIAGITMSFLVGGFFGFYPARQAAKMDPINALRAE